MAVPNTRAKAEISLEEEIGDVAVKVHGVRVVIHTDGSILACTNGNFKVCPIANGGNAAGTTEPGEGFLRIGDKEPDGTIYAGVSPDTGKAMYATPADASLTMKFNDAEEYAAKLDAHGHKDWRVPTKAELNVLFNNRAAIGGFNVSGSFPAGWYWSASPRNEWLAWGQRFNNGHQLDYSKDGRSAVRCVR